MCDWLRGAAVAGILGVVAAVVIGCIGERSRQGEDDLRIVTVVYSLHPFRRFTIRGTEVKEVGLEELGAAVREHGERHPGAVFEVLAEVNSVPSQEEEIIEVFKKAGVQLRHYWAPMSYSDSSWYYGRYGRGYVDRLEHRVVVDPAQEREAEVR